MITTIKELIKYIQDGNTNLLPDSKLSILKKLAQRDPDEEIRDTMVGLNRVSFFTENGFEVNLK